MFLVPTARYIRKQYTIDYTQIKMVNDLFFYGLVVVCFVRAVIRTTSGLHILQLDGYKPLRFLKWLSTHIRHCFEIIEIIVVAGLLIIVSIFPYIQKTNWFFSAFCLAWTAFQVYKIVRRKKAAAKKPLVYTARAKRLFGLALTLLVVSAALLVGFVTENRWRITVFLFSELTVPLLVMSSFLIWPLEQFINGMYLRDARKRIATLQPKIIGITGSYGKTSTKYILHQILSQKYNTLMTPDSYNTPMGICKVIRGDLLPKHEYFIVEMGAYKRGDIRELCHLAPPEIGILTAVGPQHLERFKSIENTARAKYELIESLPANGLAVINTDNEICAALADKTDSVPVIRYGVEANGVENASLRLKARNIKQSNKGLTFTVTDEVAGTAEITTRLLGRHNVSNILAAIGVSLQCGMTLNEIQDALEALEPVPHRLQLIAGGTGVTVIDDSFNANPEGAKAALEVLSDFVSDKNGKKVLVTPGMVELGEREYDENKQFGSEAAKVCDLVILVGSVRTTPILDGLKTANYPEQQIYVAKDLAEAQQQLEKRLKSGDVVLFENDLPDNYNEAV